MMNDMDKRLEGRKPIEAIRDEIASLKVEMIHIKNYLRKLEARETIKEEEEKKLDEEYVKPEKTGWLW
jgi:predicted transcriptional regulator